jgi:hypothetical protein
MCGAGGRAHTYRKVEITVGCSLTGFVYNFAHSSLIILDRWVISLVYGQMAFFFQYLTTVPILKRDAMQE